MKACNTVISSRINCVAYVPSNKGRRTGSNSKNITQTTDQHRDQKKVNRDQEDFNGKQSTAATTTHSNPTRIGDSLLDIDSSDEDENGSTLIGDEHSSIVSLDLSQQSVNIESDLHQEQQDTREATMWIGTDDGLFVFLRQDDFTCYI